jgi:AbrB family looped-hinge helix DNA binding protein
LSSPAVAIVIAPEELPLAAGSAAVAFVFAMPKPYHAPPGAQKVDRVAEFLHFCQTTEMKTVLTVTDRGTITLPAKLRRQLGIRAEDQLVAEATPEGLLLRPAVTLPVEMYSDKRVAEFDASEAELGEILRRKRPRRSS